MTTKPEIVPLSSSENALPPPANGSNHGNSDEEEIDGGKDDLIFATDFEEFDDADGLGAHPEYLTRTLADLLSGIGSDCEEEVGDQEMEQQMDLLKATETKEK
ncbi:hypothetical protein BG015_006336 [Linnemannia schmuckeri]|uniref:Uncharacterized protein n=1 Tax=Linnemannia schmuckeri TaxID=64567 RepID=A0A9P5S3E4_9FUNG|nr:hypothetical protein BG015_006336 [Linnemannia schmuckeri]